jgi:hypothetical protein
MRTDGNDEAKSRFTPFCEGDKNHFEDFGVAGRILEWILNRFGGHGLLRNDTKGRLLYTR